MRYALLVLAALSACNRVSQEEFDALADHDDDGFLPPEVGGDDASPGIRAAKLDLLASHGCLVRELTDRGGQGIVLDERIPFDTAVNGACANLPVDPAVRQALLEESDLLRRHARVEHHHVGHAHDE